mmetsp:Transcript_22227/g.21459  ORF Transcript_22227/g.21459 Transcript_22227/m.21459 type:complete len:125 (-) Transcript_22227:685-1059(-)
MITPTIKELSKQFDYGKTIKKQLSNVKEGYQLVVIPPQKPEPTYLKAMFYKALSLFFNEQPKQVSLVQDTTDLTNTPFSKDYLNVLSGSTRYINQKLALSQDFEGKSEMLQEVEDLQKTLDEVL